MDQQLHVPHGIPWSPGMTIQKVPDWWQVKTNLFHSYLCYHNILNPGYNNSTRTQRATLFVGHGLGSYFVVVGYFWFILGSRTVFHNTALIKHL